MYVRSLIWNLFNYLMKAVYLGYHLPPLRDSRRPVLLRHPLRAEKAHNFSGEGGTYALFQGLFPPKHNDFDDDRTLTGDSFKKQGSESSSSKLSPKLWWPLLIMVSREQ